MKIDVCESLVHSWLKYSKCCELVSTNWKIPIQAVERKEICNELFKLNLEGVYFSSNVRFSQLLRQAEADVVGYNFSNQHLYLVDAAFHEGGLGYRHPVETVLKKLLRSLIAGIGYFEGVREISILFVSPFVRENVLRRLNDRFDQFKEDVDTALAKHELPVKINIDLIFNDDFKNVILYPTINASKKIADTGDLFIRAVKLIALADKTVQRNYAESVNKENTDDIEVDKEEADQSVVSPGEEIRDRLDTIIRGVGLSSEELHRLQDKDESKRLFNLQFSFFTKDRNSMPRRYYSNPFIINKEQYYLTNHWYTKNKKMFESWFNSKVGDTK